MSFITKLKIKNFFSIQNSVELFFDVDNYTKENYRDRCFNFGDNYFSKVNSFYGANGSGKTTILKALVILSRIITNELSNNFPISFKNKFNRKNINSELAIEFILDDDIYFYEVVFESEDYKNIGIKQERLFINNKKFFDRKRKQINIKNKELKDIILNNLSKKSLIQEFVKFDNNLFKIYNFFYSIKNTTNIRSAYITNLGVQIYDESLIASILQEKDFLALKKFIVNFLNSIGIDIIDLEVKKEDTLKIYTKHKNKKQLDFRLESDGTIILIKLLMDIYFTKKFNSILVIDELDSMLHTFLVPAILYLLRENNIQIFYSTHNIYNMQFLTKSEIFLIEKNIDTKIIHLKDDNISKPYENILSYYENSAFGRVPKIENIYTKILDE